MKLLHLKYEACPHCKSKIVSETQTSRHCNGQWFETQEFACNFRVCWRPNFEREEISIFCKEMPEHKEMVRRRKAAKQVILEQISFLDVDEAFRTNMHNSIDSEQTGERRYLYSLV